MQEEHATLAPVLALVAWTFVIWFSGGARVIWPLCIAPIHDWCVESILDRMGHALRTGAVPSLTLRKMPWVAGITLSLLRLAER